MNGYLSFAIHHICMNQCFL